MKYLLLLAVIVVVLWMINARKRPPSQPKPGASKAAPGPQAMLVCAHCGVHLPQSETVADAAGRAFCSEAHRVAGPR